MMREWSDEVRLGINRSGPWSRVLGRPSRSLVRGLVKEGCVLREGAMADRRCAMASRPRLLGAVWSNNGFVTWCGRKKCSPAISLCSRTRINSTGHSVTKVEPRMGGCFDGERKKEGGLAPGLGGIEY